MITKTSFTRNRLAWLIPTQLVVITRTVYEQPIFQSPTLSERTTYLNDIWRKLATQPLEFTRQFWNLLQDRLRRHEPFNSSSSKSPGTSRRTSSKVKIVDSAFLALIGATKEMCSQIDATILAETLASTIRLFLLII